ncbi:MAG: DNA polymerase IV [Alphaproteobacteria bacterium]|nr:DNA polymerase IV [Alphaproteobacteria bacterium]
MNEEISGLCRDCAAPVPAAGRRCPDCHSPRLVRHAELDTLTIAHIDCDAFYAAIEKRDDPSLRDHPVIVGGGRRGVVSAACYVARIHGVHSAMPMFEALRLCPGATVIRPDMAKYVAVGRQVRTLMEATTPLIEPLSIDEAFLDLTGTQRLHGAPPAATLIRLARRIEDEIGVTVSIGLSYNKFLAKLASDLDKPRGFAVLGRGDAPAFLDRLPVSHLWGVGAALHARLSSDGIRSVGQLRGREERALVARYGAIGSRLWHFARGEDARSVNPRAPARSISAETTFEDDLAGAETLRDRLWPLAEKVADRLKAAGLAGRTVTLKLKTARFRLVTRRASLPAPTRLADTLWRTAVALLDRALADLPAETTYRLIGVGVSGLGPAHDADPADLADPDGGRRRQVEEAIDAVRARLGRGAIRRGRGLSGNPGPKAPRSAKDGQRD